MKCVYTTLLILLLASSVDAQCIHIAGHYLCLPDDNAITDNLTVGGNVGIGTTTTSPLLTVGSIGGFQVDTTGNISATDITISNSVNIDGSIKSGTSNAFQVNTTGEVIAVDVTISDTLTVGTRMVVSGNVGIGTTTVSPLLTVGSVGGFQVDTTGDVVAVDITSSGTLSAGGGVVTIMTTLISGASAGDDICIGANNQLCRCDYCN